MIERIISSSSIAVSKVLSEASSESVDVGVEDLLKDRSSSALARRTVSFIPRIAPKILLPNVTTDFLKHIKIIDNKEIQLPYRFNTSDGRFI